MQFQGSWSSRHQELVGKHAKLETLIANKSQWVRIESNHTLRNQHRCNLAHHLIGKDSDMRLFKSFPWFLGAEACRVRQRWQLIPFGTSTLYSGMGITSWAVSSEHRFKGGYIVPVACEGNYIPMLERNVQHNRTHPNLSRTRHQERLLQGCKRRTSRI